MIFPTNHSRRSGLFSSARLDLAFCLSSFCAGMAGEMIFSDSFLAAGTVHKSNDFVPKFIRHGFDLEEIFRAPGFVSCDGRVADYQTLAALLQNRHEQFGKVTETENQNRLDREGESGFDGFADALNPVAATFREIENPKTQILRESSEPDSLGSAIESTAPGPNLTIKPRVRQSGLEPVRRGNLATVARPEVAAIPERTAPVHLLAGNPAGGTAAIPIMAQSEIVSFHEQTLAQSLVHVNSIFST